jgi:beta-lactamase superfamily II metal-dependent hydrolase
VTQPILVLASILIGLVVQPTSESLLPELEIVVPALGWGDAAVYRGPCGEIGLIDASMTKKSRAILEDVISKRGDRFRWIVVSHYDKDHLGNVQSIGTEFSAELVYDRGGGEAAKNSGVYRAYHAWVTAPGAPDRHILVPGESFELCRGSNPVVFSVVAVNGVTASGRTLGAREENDRGVCLKITFGQFDMASCGDISGLDDRGHRDIESEVAAEIGDVEVAKVDHHGSRYSSNATFVSALDAQVAVVLAPQRKDCQPDPDVLQDWRRQGARIYITTYGASRTWRKRCADWRELATVGTVDVTTNGSDGFSVSAERLVGADRYSLDEMAETGGAMTMEEIRLVWAALLGAGLVALGIVLGQTAASWSRRGARRDERRLLERERSSQERADRIRRATEITRESLRLADEGLPPGPSSAGVDFQAIHPPSRKGEVERLRDLLGRFYSDGSPIVRRHAERLSTLLNEVGARDQGGDKEVALTADQIRETALAFEAEVLRSSFPLVEPLD